ncbi:MAG TPA: hypothetical protein VGC10_05275 [Sphingomonas sp.]
MSLLDGLLAKAEGLDLTGLAAQVGLTPDELKSGGEALLSKLAGGTTDAQDAAAHAEATTGVSSDKLIALLPVLASAFGASDHPEGPLAGIASKLGGAGGLLGSLGGLLGKS